MDIDFAANVKMNGITLQHVRLQKDGLKDVQQKVRIYRGCLRNDIDAQNARRIHTSKVMLECAVKMKVVVDMNIVMYV